MNQHKTTPAARHRSVATVVRLALGILLGEFAEAAEADLSLSENRRRTRFLLGESVQPTSAGLSLSVVPLTAAPAASATWTGTTSAAWGISTNWSPNTVPGTGDTATFNNAGNGNTTIDLGASRTINTILFDTSSAAAYTIGSGAVGSQTLILNDSGAITVNSTVTNNQLFNAAITLGTSRSTTSTITFTNNSTTAALTIAGNVAPTTGGSGGATSKTLLLTGSGNGLISGNIAGTGSGTNPTLNLTKSGLGTWTLSGTNTYAGTTTISAGTLQIGNGGTTGTLGTGAVVDNATLSFNRTNTLTVSNAISGTGALNQIGTGTTILTGTNSYAGTTTVSAGTLQIGNGGTTGTLGSGGVTNDAALVFNRSNALSVSNLISGTGSVTQAGTGTTTLTANNSYAGTTTVSAGTLFVNGNQSTATGAVSVSNSGTVLGGTGTIGGAVTVDSGAIIRGGTGATPSGTLTVGGLTMNSGSIIQLALGPGGGTNHSTLALTGPYSFQSNQTFQFINLGATTSTYQDIITGVTSDPGTGGWQFDNSFNPNFDGSFVWDSTNFTVDLNLIAVPEPSTWAGASLALVALLVHQRRRLKKLLKKA